MRIKRFILQLLGVPSQIIDEMAKAQRAQYESAPSQALSPGSDEFHSAAFSVVSANRARGVMVLNHLRCMGDPLVRGRDRALSIEAQFPDSLEMCDVISEVQTHVVDFIERQIKRRMTELGIDTIPKVIHFGLEDIYGLPRQRRQGVYLDSIASRLMPAICDLMGWQYLGSQPDYGGPTIVIAVKGYAPTPKQAGYGSELEREYASLYLGSKFVQKRAGTYVEVTP